MVTIRRILFQRSELWLTITWSYKELQKIAYIPEKEYNYLSIHNFDTSHFVLG